MDDSIEELAARRHRNWLKRLNLRESRYAVDLIGIASDSIHDLTIDSEVVVVQPHPWSTFYLHPSRKASNLSFETAWFYADCLSYDHDCPSIVHQLRRSDLDSNYRYVHAGRSKPEAFTVHHIEDDSTWNEQAIRSPVNPIKVVRNSLSEYLVASLQNARESRHGPSTYILPRYGTESDPTHVRFSNWFLGMRPAIGYYSAALKQTDFASEFLHYYRVIEFVAQNNGKRWIEDHLPLVSKHSYGKILIGHDAAFSENPKNMLSIYRRRALRRLNKLRSEKSSDKQIATHFYNANRCGIAHGGSDGRLVDTTKSYFDLAKDTVLLKMLARLAIDENYERT